MTIVRIIADEDEDKQTHVLIRETDNIVKEVFDIEAGQHESIKVSGTESVVIREEDSRRVAIMKALKREKDADDQATTPSTP